MEKRVASILLLLSIEALVLFAGLSAATTSANVVDMDIIRLPSDTALVPERVTVVRGARKHGEERPWKCCDDAVPGPSTEGMVWYCRDKVEKCTCDSCYELKDSHGYYCLDGYQGSDPGPTCSNNNILERMAVGKGSRKHGQERPWKCCDRAVPGPTTQGIVWYCMDKVEKCTCDSCYELKDSHSYYCLDGYQGSDPGPTCSHE